MHRFLRWFNQNRAEFVIIVVLIAFIFIIIRTVDGFIKVEQDQKKNELSFRNSSTNTIQNTITSKANESVITGQKIQEKVSEKNKSLIKQFVDYCNTGERDNLEKAYNLLSDECKEVLYPTLRDFITKYYISYFSTSRIYNLENWYMDSNSCTYSIKYIEDVLATGNVNSKENRDDYITVVYTDTGAKLNIGSYVGRKINGTKVNKNNVTLKVNWIDLYIDYTISNVTITNGTANTICIDTKEKAQTAFLYDENSVKYTAFLNEIAKEDLILDKGETRNLEVKYSKMYNPSRAIRGIVFQDVVLNYEKYSANFEKKDRITIKT